MLSEGRRLPAHFTGTESETVPSETSAAETNMSGRLAPSAPREELWIVLVGKTGAGKSATGNTILRKRCFNSRISTTSVTFKCQKEESEFDGQKLVVLDTPGLSDIRKPPEDVAEITRCISFAAPGPHVFLVVIQPTRFTREELNTVEAIQEMFGEEASRYTMVLFTHGDQLRADGVSVEDLMDKDPDLKVFTDQCRGGYHVIDNNDESDSQVRELLRKISLMVQLNGGSCYTNNTFQNVEEANREEMETLLRKNPHMSQKEARRRAERENAFIRAVKTDPAEVIAGAGVGAAAGACVGLAAGPLGAAIGAAVGAPVGAVVGVAVTLKKMGFSIQ